MTAAVCACFANAVTAGQAQSADEQQIRVLIAAEETGKRPYLVRCYGCGRKKTGNGRKRPFHTRARHEPARSQVDIRSRCVGRTKVSLKQPRCGLLAVDSALSSSRKLGKQITWIDVGHVSSSTSTARKLSSYAFASQLKASSFSPRSTER